MSLIPHLFDSQHRSGERPQIQTIVHLLTSIWWPSGYATVHRHDAYLSTRETTPHTGQLLRVLDHLLYYLLSNVSITGLVLP